MGAIVGMVVAEDIVCIHGTFHKSVVLKKGGVPGYYQRDGFQFPKNPFMLIIARLAR